MQVATTPSSPVAAAVRASWRDSVAHGWAFLPLRIITSAAFLYAGYQKISNPQFLNPHAPGYIGHFLLFMAKGSPINGFLTNVAVPHAQVFGFLVAYGEFAIGLGTLCGVLVRPAAFFGLICNVMYWLSASWHTPLFYHNADLLFFYMWLTLILAGGSGMALTFDPWLARWAVAHTKAAGKARMARTLAVLLGVPTSVSLPKRSATAVAPPRSASMSGKNSLSGATKPTNAATAKADAPPNPLSTANTPAVGTGAMKKSVPTNAAAKPRQGATASRPITRAGTPAGRRG
jgi:uncharacterized membrane protein YphA (DoxX/SURF4 family)